jgi:hypothetical protein
VGVIVVVGVQTVELLCCATRAVGRTQQCRGNSKDIAKKKCTYSKRKMKNSYVASNYAIHVCSCCILSSIPKR